MNDCIWRTNQTGKPYKRIATLLNRPEKYTRWLIGCFFYTLSDIVTISVYCWSRLEREKQNGNKDKSSILNHSVNMLVFVIVEVLRPRGNRGHDNINAAYLLHNVLTIVPNLFLIHIVLKITIAYTVYSKC